MMDEARRFEEEDRKKREEIELRNAADTAIFTAERAISDAKETIEAADRERIESAIADLKKALEGDDTEGDPAEDGCPDRSSICIHDKGVPACAGGDCRGEG